MTDAARFAVYAWPHAAAIPLLVTPQLESWDAKGHPSQARLASFLDHVEQVTASQSHFLTDGVAVGLTVGLDENIPLTSGGRDLDNYLFPIVRRFGHQRVASAHAIKHHGASAISIAPAMATGLAGGGWSAVSVRTSTSPTTLAWKQDVTAQIARQHAQPAPAGALEFCLCFRVSSRRNWSQLWKPAIDSCGCILGEDPGGRAFHPNDDRIVALGLHRSLDDTLGNDIQLAIWWRRAHR